MSTNIVRGFGRTTAKFYRPAFFVPRQPLRLYFAARGPYVSLYKWQNPMHSTVPHTEGGQKIETRYADEPNVQTVDVTNNVVRVGGQEV